VHQLPIGAYLLRSNNGQEFSLVNNEIVHVDKIRVYTSGLKKKNGCFLA
jgi:hypothetical protein